MTADTALGFRTRPLAVFMLQYHEGGVLIPPLLLNVGGQRRASQSAPPCTITSFFKGQGELQAVALPVPFPFQRQWATLALSFYPVTYPEQTTPIGLSHPNASGLWDRIPTTVNNVKWSSRGKHRHTLIGHTRICL